MTTTSDITSLRVQILANATVLYPEAVKHFQSDIAERSTAYVPRIEAFEIFLEAKRELIADTEVMRTVYRARLLWTCPAYTAMDADMPLSRVLLSGSEAHGDPVSAKVTAMENLLEATALAIGKVVEKAGPGGAWGE